MAGSWRIRVAILASLLLAAGCVQAQRAPDASHADHANQDVAEFFDRLRDDPGHEWLEASSAQWLQDRPRETRLRIAERAMKDSDPVIRGIAPVQYYALGLDDRGDAAFAELMLDGVDLTGVAWGWLHDRDPKLLDRRMDAIKRLVLLQYERLPPEKRSRAEKLLCKKGKPCDLASMAEEARLRR
jgi:hypothetical protein